MSRLKYLIILLLLCSSSAFATINVWTPKGQLAGLTGNSNPNVIYETSGCLILSNPCFKMWNGANNCSPGIDYFESADGLTSWTAYPSNPIVNIDGASCFPTVYKVGSTYYLFAGSGSSNLTVQTSSNGVTFGSRVTAVTFVSSGSTWNGTHIYQINLVPGTPGFGTNTGETYYAYYEGIGPSGSSEGLITTTNLAGAWTDAGSNPRFTNVAPLTFLNVGGIYYAWGPDGGGVASLYAQALGFNGITRWSAPAPNGPWTVLKAPNGTDGVLTSYPSIRADFDINGTNSNLHGTSIGDPCIVSALGNTYMYWTRSDNEISNQYGINAQVATGLTPAQLVTGYEGMVGFPIPTSSGTPLNLNILASDTFQRADGGLGANWTNLTGGGGSTTFQIASHLVEQTTAGTGNASVAYNNTVSFPNDQWSMVTLHTNNNSYTGAAVRAVTTHRYLGYFHPTSGGLGTTGGVIINNDSGGIGSFGVTGAGLTVSQGDTLMLVVSGTNLLLYYNGMPILAVTDSNLASGSGGMYSYAPSAVTDTQISAWSGGGLVASPSLSSGGFQISPFVVGP